MAYDTVVDKTQLETAMTATAAAIRGKTGGSATLAWDQSKGFADSIAQIQTGINPSGSKTITENGTFDVTSFASAVVNVPTGLNAQFYTVTLSADSTAATTFLTNDWLKSIRSKSNAFVFLRYVGVTEGVACVGFVFTATYTLWYNKSVPAWYKSVVMRQTATNAGYIGGTGGLSATSQYNGNLMIDANGKLWAYGNATYPFKAGQYQIIAGLVE